jgi:O-antigen/teichoic acid export membrane protein
MDNLKEKTAKGLFWGALNNGTIQVLNVLIGIMLGRKLSPEEWAPIGMIAIFSAIAGNLQSSGFSTAIVNMKRPGYNYVISTLEQRLSVLLKAILPASWFASILASYYKMN